VFQPVPHRIIWAGLKRDRSTIGSYLEGARTGIPVAVTELEDGTIGGSELNAADFRSPRAPPCWRRWTT
jgi:hypothetical protein